MAGARGLRVIAGDAGGLRLAAPKGARTRPTADRVKESLFSAIAGRVERAAVLDLYAGSGALGIEALSRGATSAVFVDREQPAAVAIRANLASTRLGGAARVVRRSVEGFVRGAPPAEAPFDLVFLDPPYEQPIEALTEVCRALSTPEWTGPGGSLVVERAAGVPRLTAPPGWHVTWERSSGGTLVSILSRPVG